MPDRERLQRIMARHDSLKGDRYNWESHWQEIADYVLPQRATFTRTVSPGQKRNTFIYDSTAPWACEQLANGLHAMLNNPMSRWFFLTVADPELRMRREVQKWLQTVTRIMYDEFSPTRSNFHPQLHEVYLDLGAFGLGVLYEEEATGGGVRFQAYHLNDCVIDENAFGVVDTLFREFRYTLRQVAQRWGVGQLTESQRRTLNEKPNTEVDIVHVVMPREDYNPNKRNKQGKPFASLWVMRDGEVNNTLLAEGGYDSFPYQVPRWSKRTLEKYANSPAMTSLADIRMLNEMKFTLIRSAQKLVDPPLQIPDDGFLGPVKTMPGGINYFRRNSQDRIEPLKTDARPDLGVELLTRVQQDVMRAFYMDAFYITQDSDGVNVKATFVQQRREERFRQLAGILSRLQNELHGRLIDRTFELLYKQGAFPEPPPALQGVNLDIEYVSPIARAQRTEDGENFLRLVNMLAPLAQTDPSVLSNFDGDAIARDAAKDLFNLPVEWIRSKEVVQQMRQQSAAQQNVVQGSETAKTLGDAAKAFSAAEG